MDGSDLHQVVQPPPPIASTAEYLTTPPTILYSAFSFNQVVWSPDNKYIAYIFTVLLQSTGDLGVRPRLTRLIRINTDGSDMQEFVGPAGEARWAINELIEAPDWLSWSPDSQIIAYTSANQYPLRLISVDGNRQVTIANNAYYPIWSPQGDRIAFVGGPKGQGAITIVDLKGNVLARIGTNFVQVLLTSWSPDGKQIAFAGFIGDEQTEKIIVENADGTNLREIGNGADFAWSPNGKYIAFSSVMGDQRPEAIFIFNVDSSKQYYLTNGSHIAWSPNGKYIAFTDASIDFQAGDQKLYVISTDSPGQHLLSHFFGGTPQWTADGQRITFETQNRILSVGLDGFCPSVG